MSNVPETPDGPVRFPEPVAPMVPPPGGAPWGWYQPTPIPWADFAAECDGQYEPPLRAKATQRKIRYVLGQVGELLGPGATTAGLTPALVARFIASRPPGNSPNSTYGEVATLRAICSYAVSRLALPISPFALRKHWIRRVPSAGKRHHSREEIARVLDLMARDVSRKRGWACWRAQRLQALAATVAYTGMRRNEALYLQRSDVDVEARLIRIVARAGNRLKTERAAQPVPIADGLAPVLAAWLPHVRSEWVFENAYATGPWTGGSAGHKPLCRLKRLGKRAGVDGFTFQSLRHSWASHSEHWGLSREMIARVLRHTNTRTQDTYRHADLDNIRAAVRGIGFGEAAHHE